MLAQTRAFRRFVAVLLISAILLLCLDVQQSTAQGPPGNPPSNFDAETQALIANADRVVFLIPFSHWDTDWHQSFDSYSQFADQNILKAIQLAKLYPRFRYTLEQVLFVQHFWESHPESRADLKALVQKRQITFAWAGITQPETSLVAPTVQVHNLLLGQAWIAQTFGTESVPRTAWQSDAFGNSAAFPTFLSEFSIPYLFIGRWQGKCDPDYQTCQPLPPAFYWTSPAAPEGVVGRVLVTYISYETGWADIYHRTDPDAQLRELRNTAEAEFKQTNSRYLFLPVGFDFADPQANLPALVDRWNAADPHTVLVMADPDSAFQYLATQSLPEITTDLNPIWQAFYNTRPAAKIADKESEYYLTAADKFAVLLDQPKFPDWNLAAFNAHYDNIAGVGFDTVWENSQRPRFEQTVAAAQNSLANNLAQIASRLKAPVIVFNPTSWPRSSVIELTGDNLPDVSVLPGPVQRIGPNGIAFFVKSVPPIGYTSLTGGQSAINKPATLARSGNQVTLTNGLVSVTLDGDHGGVVSGLDFRDDSGTLHQLITTFGDNVRYLDDRGDVYGAFFGQERANESQVSAQISALAAGPLVARVQAVFTLGGQRVVKTVTVRADDPLVTVDLDISALPETTALLETSTSLNATTRTDDLGFGAFAHLVDTRPIVSGDVTYRRSIFYPIMYWSDVSQENVGLTVITHGLQGIAGTAIRSFMLVRQVTQDPEGVTDPGVHHLHYAYLPHTGTATTAQSWLAAYAFNQPLIAIWHSGDQLTVQLPFDTTPERQFKHSIADSTLPATFSLLSAQNAIVADVYRQGDQVVAVVLDYDPTSHGSIQAGSQHIDVFQTVFSLLPVLNRNSGMVVAVANQLDP